VRSSPARRFLGFFPELSLPRVPTTTDHASFLICCLPLCAFCYLIRFPKTAHAGTLCEVDGAGAIQRASRAIAQHTNENVLYVPIAARCILSHK
jgi:hypothetical protein